MLLDAFHEFGSASNRPVVHSTVRDPQTGLKRTGILAAFPVHNQGQQSKDEGNHLPTLDLRGDCAAMLICYCLFSIGSCLPKIANSRSSIDNNKCFSALRILVDL
jgi:hypothetical protein